MLESERAGALRGIGNFGDGAGELAVLERIDFQAGLLAGPDQHDVDFADVDSRLHRLQVRDGHDFGPGILDRAENALAELGIQFADGAGQRRDDGGLGELLLRR